jgi:hypothetical protein
VAENLHTRYTRQVFTPTRRHTLGDDVPQDAVQVAPWHLDIDKSELRWESYVKAGYYVCVFALFGTILQPFKFLGILGCPQPLPLPIIHILRPCAR